MSLKMSKQAIPELPGSNETKYRKSRCRKVKSELPDQLLELTGYKSSKNIIRHCSRKRKRRKAEKRGRLPKLHPEGISLIKGIRFLSGQPCGKRFHSLPATWLDSLSKRCKMDKEVTSRIHSVSPATHDRVLSKFKTDGAQKRNRHKARELTGCERVDEEECVYLPNQV